MPVVVHRIVDGAWVELATVQTGQPVLLGFGYDRFGEDPFGE